MPDENIIKALNKAVITKQSDFTQVIKDAVEDGYKRLIKPAIEREVRNSLTEKQKMGQLMYLVRT